MFRLLRQGSRITYSLDYLENNEPTQVDGCMLAATYENQPIWYLYNGSREVVDRVINRPITLDSTARPDIVDTHNTYAFPPVTRQNDIYRSLEGLWQSGLIDTNPCSVDVGLYSLCAG